MRFNSCHTLTQVVKESELLFFFVLLNCYSHNRVKKWFKTFNRITEKHQKTRPKVFAIDSFGKWMVPILLGLDKIALAALAKLLNTPPTTAAKPAD